MGSIPTERTHYNLGVVMLPKTSPTGQVLSDVLLTDDFVLRVAVGEWRSQPHITMAFAQEIIRLRGSLAEAHKLLDEIAAGLERDRVRVGEGGAP